MRIIIMGAPGSGKGTLSKALSKRLVVPHISIGDLVRHDVDEAIKAGNKVGVLIKKQMDEGQLGSKELWKQLRNVASIKNRLSKPDCVNGFILDGVRFEFQFKEIAELMLDIRFIFHIKVSFDESIARLIGRRECITCGESYHVDFNPPKNNDLLCDNCGMKLSKRKEDDSIEKITTRLSTYENITSPLISSYRKKGLLVDIDGNKKINEVVKDVLKILTSPICR